MKNKSKIGYTWVICKQIFKKNISNFWENDLWSLWEWNPAIHTAVTCGCLYTEFTVLLYKWNWILYIKQITRKPNDMLFFTGMEMKYKSN